MACFGPSRGRSWIPRVRELSVRGSRAPDDIWDPISGPSPQKCERFLNILKFAMETLKFNYFVWPAWATYWPGTAKKRILTFGRRDTAEQRHPKTPEKQQQQEEERVTKRAARFARRPLVMFLLSQQCRAQLCQVSVRVRRVTVIQ